MSPQSYLLSNDIITPAIVNIAVRPDLVPVVAGWLFEAFWRQEGHELAEVVDALRQSAPAGMPQSFVLIAGGEAAGTASFAAHDLDERPDLTPWLAGMFVAPAHRRRLHAAMLVKAVEQAAREADVKTLWLYTNSAEALYARAGWERAGTISHLGVPKTLMRRNLSDD
jgi:predicted N-acetyltransferase YhbS